MQSSNGAINSKSSETNRRCDAMQTAPAKTTKTEKRRSMKLVAVTSIAAGVNWVKDQCNAVEYLASKRFF